MDFFVKSVKWRICQLMAVGIAAELAGVQHHEVTL